MDAGLRRDGPALRRSPPIFDSLNNCRPHGRTPYFRCCPHTKYIAFQIIHDFIDAVLDLSGMVALVNLCYYKPPVVRFGVITTRFWT